MRVCNDNRRRGAYKDDGSITDCSNDIVFSNFHNHQAAGNSK